jgi:hypothetical protein
MSFDLEVRRRADGALVSKYEGYKTRDAAEGMQTILEAAMTYAPDDYFYKVVEEPDTHSDSAPIFHDETGQSLDEQQESGALCDEARRRYGEKP